MAVSKDLMSIGEQRTLTPGEIALGRSVFGSEIVWEKVRVRQARALGFGAMVPLGKTIVFSNWRAVRDFSAASVSEQAWFIHELAHVWQAGRGKVLALSKLRALGRKAYGYRAARGLTLRNFNIEQQAEIVRHLFLARLNADEKGAPSRFWLEEIWATRRAGAA